MLLEKVNLENFEDLPEYTYLISKKDNPIFPLSGESKDYLAIIGNVIEEENLDWDKVVKGEQHIKLFLVTTERFIDQNEIILESISKRLLKLKGVLLETVYYGSYDNLVRVIYSIEEGNEVRKNVTQLEVAQKNFDKICQDAIKRKASDIHFSITPDEGTIVYFRTDGRLKYYQRYTQEYGIEVLSSAYNSLADESSRTGTFSLKNYQNCAIERNYKELGVWRFRFASSPKDGGVYAVLRTLPIGIKNEKTLSITDLGGEPSHALMIKKIFSQPSGLALMVGTTGSGKSTTIKHILQGMVERAPYKNYCSLEEPIEYKIKGVQQLPVVRGKDDQEGGKNAFTEAVKAMMRLDPDVALIGEIRDQDTAKLAGAATESGHFIMSTLHASSAIDIFGRLSGDTMKLPLSQLCSPGFIAGSIYQKLIPTLCPNCKVEIDLKGLKNSSDEDDRYFYKRLSRVIDMESLPVIYKTNKDGCDFCDDGIKGRTVCMEVLIPDDVLLEYIKKGEFIKAIHHWRNSRNVNDDNNFQGKTVLDHAILKMKKGIIDPYYIEEALGEIDKEVIMEDGIIDSDEVSVI